MHIGTKSFSYAARGAVRADKCLCVVCLNLDQVSLGLLSKATGGIARARARVCLRACDSRVGEENQPDLRNRINLVCTENQPIVHLKLSSSRNPVGQFQAATILSERRRLILVEHICT